MPSGGNGESRFNTSDPIWITKSSSIDPTKLPLDNEKYSSAPQAGSIYPCNPRAYFNILLGSSKTGPWVNIADNTWDITQKPYVQGAVAWPSAVFSVTADPSTNTRLLKGNGLPVGGTTGNYPVQQNDPAYAYDRNRNAVTPHNVSIALPLNPVLASRSYCIQPLIGYALDGVAFEFALSSYKGHDEIAYEMQDSCGTMPDPVGILHRHALSSCIPHIRERNALVGYALDGFGIFSPYDESGKELTTKDLDDCHGTTTPIMWDGKRVTMYHYVLTRDYPYTIGCFRGLPNYQPLPGARLSASPASGSAPLAVTLTFTPPSRIPPPRGRPPPLSINFGDGTDGMISKEPGGKLGAAHTYSQSGTYTITVSVDGDPIATTSVRVSGTSRK